MFEEDLKDPHVQRMMRAFAPLAMRYRKAQRLGFTSAAGLFVGCNVAGAFGAPTWVIVGLAFLFAMVLCFSIFWQPDLLCPRCGENVEKGFGSYCPECGVEALAPAGFVASPMCGSCGRSMYKWRGQRRWLIRACTHCGCRLDLQGV